MVRPLRRRGCPSILLRSRSGSIRLRNLTQRPVVESLSRPAQAWWYRGLVAIAYSLALSILVPSGSPSQQRLQLTEIESLEIPEDWVPTGLHVGTNNWVVLWSEGRGTLLVTERPASEFIEVAPLSGAPIGARIVSTSPLRIEFADRFSSRLLTVGQDGEITGIVELSEDLTLASAQHSDGDWYVASHPDSGRVQIEIHRVDANGVVHLVHSVVEPERSAYYARPSLSRTEGGILLTRENPPFSALLINSTGSSIQTLRPFDDSNLGRFMEDGPEGIWISLGMVDFREGFVQTLADLRGDRRLLITYSPEGVPLRRTALNAPFGVVEASWDEQTIYAVRDGNGIELVIYRWKWTEGVVSN